MAHPSRREFLKHLRGLLPLSAAVLWFPAADAAADSSGKVPKEQINYRLVGCNDGTNCMNCRFFKPAESAICMGMMDAQCQLVVGSINPMAYCDLFAPLPRAD